MKLILIPLILVLSACTTAVPVTRAWPQPPGTQSQQPCPPLKHIPENSKLSDVAKTVSSNYSEYYQCSIKLQAWQDWYREQQKLYESQP